MANQERARQAATLVWGNHGEEPGGEEQAVAEEFSVSGEEGEAEAEQEVAQVQAEEDGITKLLRYRRRLQQLEAARGLTNLMGTTHSSARIPRKILRRRKMTSNDDTQPTASGGLTEIHRHLRSSSLMSSSPSVGEPDDFSHAHISDGNDNGVDLGAMLDNQSMSCLTEASYCLSLIINYRNLLLCIYVSSFQ
eukprot:TRINITY_DN9812_c0_g1_i1.p1 TRINITY_DN9812_c0_g1~~TRINITY_DN9812_c0_g1_i1.p1  ORF type:complete len:193 (-),score=22.13 TRINITY_DN9812_c0_g1_i1:628-1206(-)